ncbi:MAG: DMT family transporter [Flavobacteriales bacterium]|jgi:drug/metabolite transporter (DMT)-like permease|nr:DMT family transporter [Flavobacteriales bacterium]
MGGMKKKQSDERLNWLLLLVLALIWGSSFILMKRGLFHDGQPVLTPFQMASARLSIAWLALTPFLLKYWQELRKHWLPLLGSGVLGNGIPAFLFASAQSRISSSLSGMLNSLTPLFALVLGVALFRQRMRLVHVAGVLLGLCGAVGLIALGSADGLPSWSIYALMPVIATACYGMSANIVKHHLYMLPATATSALALTFVGPLALVLVFFSGLPEALSNQPHAWRSLGYVALLATMSSALALVLWNVLLKRTSALWASSVTYLMPVVAIGWGLLDGESLSMAQLGMIAVVLSGIYLVNVAERR